jgi:hypothetical protein
MSPTRPRPTHPSPSRGWDEPAADETVSPADGVEGTSRRLVAIGVAALVAILLVLVLSAVA